MPRPVGSVSTPSYRRHKRSGQAVVTIGGTDHYLGPWKSKASRTEYDRLIGEWLANGRRAAVDAYDLDMLELIHRYWKWAEEYFHNADSHGQIDNLKSALKIVKTLYGDTPAVNFGPLALRTVQQAMVDEGWCRTHVNAQVGRVRRMIKWAVARELLPPSAHHALEAVEGLRYGKSEARESEPVKPVPGSFVDAVLPFLSAQVKAMVELQSLTGMRSGEICRMRGKDIDRNAGEGLWSYRPEKHKTTHRGQDRVVWLGKQCQQIIAPFLKMDPEVYLFSPREAEAARREALHQSRKTPMSCGNKPGTNRKRKPKKEPGDRYDTHSYRRAVAEACQKAFPPPERLTDGMDEAKATAALRKWRREHQWHPHRLRHNHGTDVRRRYGLEAVQAALGQKSVTAAQIYAEKNSEVAQRIASEVG